MKVFISGGCKNGKSSFAQELAVQLSGSGKRYYVATMIPCDEEDRQRIRRHIKDREGLGFDTLEIGRDIASCLGLADNDATFLIDSVTALLLNEMFPAFEQGNHAYACGDTPAGPDSGAVSRCVHGLTQVLKRVRHAVFVSDYLYSDAFRYDAFTENFRASLAKVDRILARECDTVVELCAGNVIIHKGAL